MTGIPTLASIIGITITLIGAIAGFASLWGAMRQKQKDQDEKVKALSEAQACTDARSAAQDAVIARIDEGLKSVKDDLKSVNAKIDRLLDRQASGRDV